jgi:putative ABC transport system permease protein
MKTWSLALRNLLRNQRRSLATLLALAIGSAAILIFGGFSANIKYSMLTGYVRAGGHLQIQHRDFFLYGNGNPAAYGLGGYEQLLEAIRTDPLLRPMVVVATPTLQLGGIAGNYDAGVSRTVVGTGMVAEDVQAMRLWNEFSVPMDSPPFALVGSASDAAIVGVGVARVLLLCDALAIHNCPRPEAKAVSGTGIALPDDIALLAETAAGPATSVARRAGARIELLAGQGRGTPNVTALQVLAAEDQGVKELDEVAVILHFKQAQALVYGRSPPKATAIMIQLQRTDQVGQASELLKALIKRVAPGQALGVLDYVVLNPFYVQTLDLFNMIFGFIFALIGGIVLFTVSNTMNAAVVERTVEVGTLRAVGLRRSGITRLFIAEGFMLGCGGALTGLSLALVVGGVVNALNLTWLPPGSSELLPLTLRIWGETTMLLLVTLGLILIATLSAWWPAWRAARLNIVEALRHA